MPNPTDPPRLRSIITIVLPLLVLAYALNFVFHFVAKPLGIGDQPLRE